MQLIHPGQSPLALGFLILILSGIALFGVFCLTIAIQEYRKEKRGRYFWFGLTLSIPALLFPTYNWIGYGLEYSSREAKLAVYYMKRSEGLVLNADHSWIWKSRLSDKNCKSGTWEYIISEEMETIHLYGENGTNCMY